MTLFMKGTSCRNQNKGILVIERILLEPCDIYRPDSGGLVRTGYPAFQAEAWPEGPWYAGPSNAVTSVSRPK